MTTPAIVSFGMGGWYPQGIQRLRQSCEPYNVQFMGYTHYPPFCPNHKELPYAFKVYCMEAVSVTNPVMLWLDSSAWLTQDPTPIFDHIREHGYFLLKNHGQFNNWWCTDDQLNAFGYFRELAREQQHVVGGMIGLDLSHEMGRKIFDLWKGHIKLFAGLHSNVAHTESQSDECKGSRHDQSVMSLIAHKLGLDLQDQAGYVTFAPDSQQAIVAMRGM